MTLPFILAGPTLPFEDVSAATLTAYSQLHGKSAPTTPTTDQTFFVTVDGQESAVKPLPSVRSDSTRVVQWGRALEQLPRHDNVISPSHLIFSRGSAYVVMPYIRSYTLDEYRRKVYGGGPLPEEAVRLLALDVLCGLYHLRVHDLVHRNLHPGNVLVDATTGVGRVADLSYAQVLHSGAAAMPLERRHPTTALSWTDPAVTPITATPNTTTTTKTSAPKAASPAMDVWGFGMLLHTLCGATGTPFVYPANGDLAPIVSREYTTSVYSDDLRDLMRLCLQPDPTRRPTIFQVLRHNFVFPAVLLALEASRIPAKPSTPGLANTITGLANSIRQSSLLENMATAMGEVKERASELWSALFSTTTAAPTVTRAPMATSSPATVPLEHTPPPSLTSLPDRQTVLSVTQNAIHDTETDRTNRPQHVSTTTSSLATAQEPTRVTQSTSDVHPTPSLAPRLVQHELICGTTLSNRNQIETNVHGQPQLLADYGLLFEIEVRNESFVLNDLVFSTAATRSTMLAQLWWRPTHGTAPRHDLTSATFDATTPETTSTWRSVLAHPKTLTSITPRANLAVGPFRLPLPTHADGSARRYSLLLCTNSPHGVRYYGAAHGLVERDVGEVLQEDAAVGVYLGVACGGGVWRALVGDDALASTTPSQSEVATAPSAVHTSPSTSPLVEALSQTVVQQTHAKGFCGALKYSVVD